TVMAFVAPQPKTDHCTGLRGSTSDPARTRRRRKKMYVVVHHRFINPETAFARGEKLIKQEGAPAGASGLQFYPSSDGSEAVCLWEAPSVESIQKYVDATLGDSSANACFEVNSGQAFADRPSGLPESAAVRA
ncbi:MAG TPA: hypothetical protein VHJ82_00115, partial [Actinomycetota bacterium]|nr:hypothetical protein [Actinomycetota bacterium]